MKGYFYKIPALTSTILEENIKVHSRLQYSSILKLKSSLFKNCLKTVIMEAQSALQSLQKKKKKSHIETIVYPHGRGLISTPVPHTMNKTCKKE